jgi:Rne/Rng family ribonuclease
MGNKKIIVSERDNIAALFEDEKAIEFIINRGNMLLGDVYLATVENILPSIDAAFVNVGGDKMGFLHSSDVQGKGDLRTRLQPKQQLIVQVMKEPTGHKGPRVTTHISLPGRFLVLMPDSKGISISRKIEQQTERSRLKSIVSLIKPAGVGVIIRTEADQQKESDVQEDFEILLERWQNIVTLAESSQPPALLYRDQDLLYRVIREVVTDDVKEIFVDTAFGQSRAQQLLQNWNMEKAIKVHLFSGNQSILVGMGVEREIKQALQTKVPLPLGGYLYIQPTEALTVVDVNSGKFTSLQSQSETIRLTNLEATKEIARQLRLRNVGGMVIVDFIDMESRADQLALLEAFENELAPDKAKPQIGQLSDLGLVEMTRHRQGQSLSEIFTKRCIACNGTGHAVEEFNWAPPIVDTDGRQRFNRGNKMPLRARGGGAASGQPTQPPRPMSAAPIPTISLKKILETPTNGSKADEDKTLEELLKDRLLSLASLHFSSIIKASYAPPAANAVLSRINPKCNDILTLVHAIENSTGVIGEDDEDGEGDDEDDVRREEPVLAAAVPVSPSQASQQVAPGEAEPARTAPSPHPHRRPSAPVVAEEAPVVAEEAPASEAAFEGSEETPAAPAAPAAVAGVVEDTPKPSATASSRRRRSSPKAAATSSEEPSEAPKRRRGRPPKQSAPSNPAEETAS